MQFRPATLDELTIDDRAPLTGVAIYQRLETFLRGSGHRFLIPEAGQQASWDRALFLNLTYWNVESGADVLCDDHIPADVVAHVAWHELDEVVVEVRDHLGRGARVDGGGVQRGDGAEVRANDQHGRRRCCVRRSSPEQCRAGEQPRLDPVGHSCSP